MFDDTDLPVLAISKTPANTMLAVPGIAGKTYELPDDLRRYLALFTYLGDKAAWDYQAARNHMLAWNDERENNKSAFILPTAVSFGIDNCIVTLHRLVRVFSAMSKGANHFLMNRSEKTLIEGYLARLADMRNALQHTEEDLVVPPSDPRHIPAGTPVFPHLPFKTATIHLGINLIRSHELKDMVERLHAMALRLAVEIKRFDNMPQNRITNADRKPVGC